ncbi:MAG TPA: SPFH domain-containing protein [Bacteroidales bacterium]|nr:SPFH domain-containing protein [Bacteroidales bacterium]HQI46512.1 SPFH domain-containing protein [Bacteroidales bacterium]
MGILNKIKGEFIDIIEWLDPSNDTMIHRFERYENEIKYGAKLIVRETQVAVFVNEGQIADVFLPGTITLETQNMPILTTLKGWKYGFHSPFKAEVYFCNTKNFTDLKWGTKNPVMMRDTDFGMVRIRAFGNYAMRIKDPVKFIKEIAGTDGSFTTDKITEQLKNIVMTRFTDIVASSKIPVLDLASNYDELSKFVYDRIGSEFLEYGIELSKFLVENISLPPEVEAAMDKRTSMGVVGNLNAFTQYQTAIGIEEAAKNPGGSASAGIGMGMGFAMANQMGQNMSQNNNINQQQNTTPPPLNQYYVAVNGQQSGPFGEQQLAQMAQSGQLTKDSLVWKNGMAEWLAAGQVPEVAKLFTQVPPPLPPQK